MIERTYRCNLCRDSHTVGGFGPDQLVGLYWTGRLWEQRALRETENHICVKCLSSLQALPARCGQGYECTGGPTCSSDHK